MKKIISILGLFIFMGTSMMAQKYFTKSGAVSFYSNAPLEKIEADNKSSVSVIDFATGKMEFAVLIKAFQFEKALMQEHFNENYMESDKFPKALFKGTLQDYQALAELKDGSYQLPLTGDLTIHGVTNPIETTASFMVKGGKVQGEAEFSVQVADFDIKIPNVVRDNIAKEVKISINADYEPLNK